MAQIVLVRRRGLGHGSTIGLSAQMSIEDSEKSFSIWRHDRNFEDISQTSSHTLPIFIRWGCTARLPVQAQLTVQTASAIQEINQKKDFLIKLQDNTEGLTPPVFTSFSDNISDTRLVLRPSKHAQGRKLFVVSPDQLFSTIRSKPRTFRDGWYARPLINKTAEYRVYVVKGKVACVARKHPRNTNAVAWNVAQGGYFENVRWDQWPIEACKLAIESYKQMSVDFTGVDIMIDHEGRPWFIEANSAPSLPLNSDGTPTYRHKCMAKALLHTIDTEKEELVCDGHYEGWREYVHPAVWERHRDNHTGE